MSVLRRLESISDSPLSLGLSWAVIDNQVSFCLFSFDKLWRNPALLFQRSQPSSSVSYSYVLKFSKCLEGESRCVSQARPLRWWVFVSSHAAAEDFTLPLRSLEPDSWATCTAPSLAKVLWGKPDRRVSCHPSSPTEPQGTLHISSSPAGSSPSGHVRPQPMLLFTHLPRNASLSGILLVT